MTIIEVYDKVHPICNVMSQALFPEAKIIYVGSRDDLSVKARERLKNYFLMRGAEEPEFRPCEAKDIRTILDVLSGIAKEPDCYIELCGGSEIFIAAMGILAAREHFPVFRIDPDTGGLKAAAGAFPAVQPAVPDIRFEQLLSLTGGCIGGGSEDQTLLLDDRMKNAVDALWQIYIQQPGSYNKILSRFSEAVNSRNQSEDDLGVSIEGEDLEQQYDLLSGIIQSFSERNLIRLYRMDQDRIDFAYTSQAAKEMVSKSGLVLELFGRIAALSTGRFSDVRQGVKLDWDGNLNENGRVSGTNNEVDLILVDGFKTWYISCKSGGVDKTALYELRAIAEHFDTGNVKLALICDDIDSVTAERAQDMNIQVIKDVSEYRTFGDLGKRLKKL